MTNSFEKGPERILTSGEVMEIIFQFAEQATIVRELSDEQGLYLLEAEIEGREPGEMIQYNYMRKGRFPNGFQSSETSIHMVFYQDGLPCGGHCVANYNDETGEWAEVK